MTRFAVDASAVLHLASAEVEVSNAHELLAPTFLRSQTLSALHEAVQRGEIPAEVGRDRLIRVGRLPIRLLGDAVLRRRAWDLAGSAGMGLDLRRRVRRNHTAAGGRVRDAGRGTGAQRGRDRRDRADRHPALGGRSGRRPRAARCLRTGRSSFARSSTLRRLRCSPPTGSTAALSSRRCGSAGSTAPSRS